MEPAWDKIDSRERISLNHKLPLVDELELVIVEVLVPLDVVLLDWTGDDVVRTKELWWFSVWRLNDLASQ